MIACFAALPFEKGRRSRPNSEGMWCATTRGRHAHRLRLDLAEDVIEEAINLFRPNCFSKSFDIRGPADRTLVYLLLFLGDCLARLSPAMPQREAQRALAAASAHALPIPGEAAFSLPASMFPPPRDAAEGDRLRAYLGGLRLEAAARLLDRLYYVAEGGPAAVGPNKWWMAFQKRKFMNKTL